MYPYYIFFQGSDFRVLSDEEIQQRRKAQEEKKTERTTKLNKRKEKKKEQEGKYYCAFVYNKHIHHLQLISSVP